MRTRELSKDNAGEATFNFTSTLVGAWVLKTRGDIHAREASQVSRPVICAQREKVWYATRGEGEAASKVIGGTDIRAWSWWKSDRGQGGPEPEPVDRVAHRNFLVPRLWVAARDEQLASRHCSQTEVELRPWRVLLMPFNLRYLQLLSKRMGSAVSTCSICAVFACS